MAIDASTAVMLFFLVVTVLPLAIYFGVKRLARNLLTDLIVRRALLAVFCLMLMLTASVVNVLSVKSELGIEGFANVFLEVATYGLLVVFLAIFFLTIKDYLAIARGIKAGRLNSAAKDENEAEGEGDDD